MANQFLTFAVDSKDAIDDSIKSIIGIFESLYSILSEQFTTIAAIWNDLTGNIGDDANTQISFMDAISVALRALGVIVTGFQVGVQSAFAIIRAVVVTVCQALIIAFNGLMAGFDMVRSTINTAWMFYKLSFKHLVVLLIIFFTSISQVPKQLGKVDYLS